MQLSARPRGDTHPSSSAPGGAGPTATVARAHRRRQGPRQPLNVGAPEEPRHSLDRPASLLSRSPPSRRPRPPPLAHRAHQRLAAQLPSARHSLRQQERAPLRLSLRRAHADHATPVAKPLPATRPPVSHQVTRRAHALRARRRLRSQSSHPRQATMASPRAAYLSSLARRVRATLRCSTDAQRRPRSPLRNKQVL